jgi:hypothetical protein
MGITNDHGYVLLVLPGPFLIIIYHLVCNETNTTGVTIGTGTAYHSGAPELTYKQTKSVNNRKTVKTVMTLTCMFVSVGKKGLNIL